ncbi:MAG: acyltransferase family protein [Actinomycetota bacterium]|nr:acyltransferase family protein [Actinomycetota bacterium]
MAHQGETKSVRLSYLPGLDGLRALAVIAVLLYHAQLTWIPGGFLGVEVFFVISGYLITALLLEEWRRQGRINVVGFWMRRARRLLPALYLLLVVTLTFAVVFLPGEVARLREDALAAFGYVTNWYLIVGEESYFEAVGRPSLLQHLWSLAVEEQFYVLWPLLLVTGMMLLRGRALPVVLLGAVGSALLMAILYRPDVDPSRVYYGTDTRVAGLLLGAALAFVWVPGRLGYRIGRIPPLLLDIVGLAALGGLVWFCLWLDQYQPFLFRGGFALVALVTAVVIMIAVHPRARLLGAGLLGRQPLRWVGLRSYGIYLWHWPVFMVTRPELDVTITGLPLLALRLATTVVLADLSYRFVETPIRNGAFGRAWKALREARGARRWRLGVRWAGAVGTSTAFLAVLVVALIHAQPPAPPSYLSVESIHTTGSTPTPDTEDPDTTAGTETPPTPDTEDPDTTAGTETPKTDIPATATPEAGAVGSSTAPEPAAKAQKAPVSAPADRVTAIGDSVMIGAAGELQRSLGNPAMYADVGMQAAGVIEILQKRRAAGDLGEVVVIHIGSNGTLNAEQFDEMMRMLKDVRRVAFVNVKVPRPWEQPNNEVLADGVRRYPNTVLVDWHAASVDRPELFVEDGIHLQAEGQRVYADLIAAHLNAP